MDFSFGLLRESSEYFDDPRLLTSQFFCAVRSIFGTRQSFTGFLLGDIVAQSPDISAGKPWDKRRTAKMGAFGLALHGPIGHYWYGFLDKTIMVKAPTSAAAVFSKTAIDQVLWAPIFTSVFFASMKVMDGKADEISGEVSQKLWPTMKVNCTWMLCNCVLLIELENMLDCMSKDLAFRQLLLTTVSDNAFASLL